MKSIPLIPTDRARHRSPRVHSKNNPTERKGKGKGKGKGKVPVWFYKIHSSNSDASSIHDNEKDEVPDFIDDEYLGSIGVMKLILLESAIRVEK